MINNTAWAEKDQYVLSELKKAGYGWRKYAESVIAHQHITEKQRETLWNMLRKLRTQQCNAQHRKSQASGKIYEPDISDLEAMQSGDYF